ncbi:CidA/LrgA family protein [Microbaculum sp. FT89]|uniref:CidA/LrgA family protein n=1 Tax=Microbaculum sp. FT89 TaxID=3447298 RepID=UPI003F538514
MIAALTVLLACQLAGEVLVRLTDLPVPGPVLGLVILLIGIGATGRIPQDLRETATGLLTHLSLLFVPAGVGVMLHFERIGTEWLALLAALLLSTWATIAVSALVFVGVTRMVGGAETDDPDGEGTR